jgi:hypothetical protein
MITSVLLYQILTVVQCLLSFLICTLAPLGVTLVVGSCWQLLRSGSIGKICTVVLRSLLENVLYVSRIKVVPKSHVDFCNLLKILLNVLITCPWILLWIYLAPHVAMMLFLASLIDLVDWYVLYLVRVTWQLLMQHNCSLSIGFVDLACLLRSLVIVIHVFRVVFGSLWWIVCNVALLLVPPTTLRQMALPNVTIDL